MLRRNMIALSLLALSSIAPAAHHAQASCGADAPRLSGGPRIGKRRTFSRGMGTPKAKRKGKHTNRAARTRRRRRALKGRC